TGEWPGLALARKPSPTPATSPLSLLCIPSNDRSSPDNVISESNAARTECPLTLRSRPLPCANTAVGATHRANDAPIIHANRFIPDPPCVDTLACEPTYIITI